MNDKYWFILMFLIIVIGFGSILIEKYLETECVVEAIKAEVSADVCQ